MKYFYTTLLLFQIIIINTSAQTWNTQMVNPGSLISSQHITYSSTGNPIILLKSGTTLLLSIWDGNTWLNKIVETYSSGVSTLAYFIFRVDTTFIVGIHTTSTYSNQFTVRLYDEMGNYIRQLSRSFGNSNPYITNTNSPDSVLIAYSGSNGVKYVSYNIIAHSWGQEVLVDNSPSLSQTSITISPSNHIWLSYYDNSGKNLKIAKSNFDGSWDIYFADTEGDVGRYSKIFIDNSNTAHIAYYDATNQKLKYATFNPD